jgi:hypothetical protein
MGAIITALKSVKYRTFSNFIIYPCCQYYFILTISICQEWFMMFKLFDSSVVSGLLLNILTIHSWNICCLYTLYWTVILLLFEKPDQCMYINKLKRAHSRFVLCFVNKTSYHFKLYAILTYIIVMNGWWFWCICILLFPIQEKTFCSFQDKLILEAFPGRIVRVVTFKCKCICYIYGVWQYTFVL